MFTNIIAMSFFTSLLPLVSLAQEPKGEKNDHNHDKLVDIDTFGGPNSSFVGPPPAVRLLNNRGAAVGGADTPTLDPPSCFNFDCYLFYGIKWQDGVAHKLAALPGFHSSLSGWASDTGLVAGASENDIEPLTGTLAMEAVFWGKDDSISDLGALGGNDSSANAVNHRGQVAGEALNTIPDPYTSNFLIPGATQVRAFRWTKSQITQDLGTLGGTDRAAFSIDERGQIAGWSFTNTTVNSRAGITTQDAVFGENGEMLDLGTLGGTPGVANDLNNRGQVVGASNLTGDLTKHPFLRTKTQGLEDLGTLGGTFGHANYINDAGDVVGTAMPTGDPFGRAFLWRSGVMIDLSTLGTDPDSEAYAVNLKGQVVGIAGVFGVVDHRAFLWDGYGPMIDLNTLIPPNPGLQLTHALYVNDHGETAAEGTLSNGDIHAFIPIPCGENHEDVDVCDYGAFEAQTEARVRAAQVAQTPAATSAAKLSPVQMMMRFQPRRAARFAELRTSPK